MFFSIIVPVFNVDQYIEECIDSILLQNCNDYELILIDDGSTDRSGEICDLYDEKYDQIVVIHKENGGLSDARNKGIEISKGEYILFIDSDDYLVDNTLLDGAKDFLIFQKNCDLLLFGFVKVKNDNKKNDTIDDYNFRLISLQDAVKNGIFYTSAWCKIIKREIIIEHKLFFEMNIYSEDMDWCARLSLTVDTICYTECCSYAYRQRNDSISKNISEKNVQDIENNIKRSLALDINNKSDKFKSAFFDLLARNFSTYIIALAVSSNSDINCHKDYIKEYMHILTKACRKREKIIYFFLKVLGITGTLNILKSVYRCKDKI